MLTTIPLQSRRMDGLAFCLALVTTVFSTFAGAQAQMTAGQERYRIGYQDRLTVQVFRHPELTQTVEVNPNGTINLFRLDDPVVALCRTERELADDIAAAYRKDYLRNPEVNVVVTEQRSQSFAVIGAVAKPANFAISRRISGRRNPV